MPCRDPARTSIVNAFQRAQADHLKDGNHLYPLAELTAVRVRVRVEAVRIPQNFEIFARKQKPPLPDSATGLFPAESLNPYRDSLQRLFPEP